MQEEKFEDNFGEQVEEALPDEVLTGPTGTSDEGQEGDATTGSTAGTVDSPTGATTATAATAATSADTTISPTGPTGETAEMKEEDVFNDGQTGPTSVTGATGIQTTGENYSNIGKELGLNITENSKDAFLKAVKSAIEDASKKTELDLSTYNPETRTFIEAIEQPDSSLLETISPITGLDHYLANTKPEQIVTDYLIDVEKLSISDARSKIADMVAEEEFDDKFKQIINSYNNLKLKMTKDLLVKIQTASDTRKKSMDAEVEKERNEMIEVVKATDNFLGVKIPEQIRNNLINEIKSGVLTKENNNARTQVNARLFTLYAQNLRKYYEGKIKEASRKAYNDGATSIKRDLHNEAPAGHVGAASGSDYARKHEDGPLSGFLGIEDDIGVENS